MKTFFALTRLIDKAFLPMRPVGDLRHAEEPIAHIVADSRQVQPGDVFVAVQGGKFDGHRAIPEAVARGAIGVIGTRSEAELRATLSEPCVRTVHPDPAYGEALKPRRELTFAYLDVKDARAALALGNAWLHDFPARAMRVVGVTGTDGKTTTSSLIEAILVEATRSDATPHGSVGVVTTVGARIQGEESATGLHVTTPDAPEVQQFLADMRDAGCTYAVIESTSHGLDQQRVGSVDYDIGVVTNITHEHLDYHGTRAAYVAAKAILFRMLFHSPAKIGVPRCAILNADDAGSLDALKLALRQEEELTGQAVQTRTYGLPAEAVLAQDSADKPDLYATQVTYRPDGTHAQIHWWWGPAFEVTSPLIGEFNLYNIMAAAAATLALGVPPAIVARGVAGFHGVLGRMERMVAGQEFTAIVDFAHSPASLERALLTLRPLVGIRADGSPGRLIAVFGSAGLRDRTKRKWMGQISGQLADMTVVTAEDPRTEDVNDICAEIAAGVREFADASRLAVVPDRTEAIQHAVDLAQRGDIVAAFGKGHERSMCYGETEYPWSDQDAMLQALARRQERSKSV